MIGLYFLCSEHRPAGPLPKLKGVSDIVVCHIDPPFLPMTSDDVEMIKQKFLECEPANGLLQGKFLSQITRIYFHVSVLIRRAPSG